MRSRGSEWDGRVGGSGRRKMVDGMDMLGIGVGTGGRVVDDVGTWEAAAACEYVCGVLGHGAR